MRLVAVSTIVMILATCGVMPGAPEGDPATAEDATPADLPTYMRQLSALVDLCRQAATLVNDGRPAEAIRLLHEAEASDAPGHWKFWVRQRANALEQGPPTNFSTTWWLDMGRPDLTAELYEQRLHKRVVEGEDYRLDEVQLTAQCWAAVGRYARAREVLDKYLKQELPRDTREAIRLHRESLEGLRENEPMTVPLFRKLRDAKALPHGLRPPDVVRLWKIPAAGEAEQVEKVKLLIDMLRG